MKIELGFGKVIFTSLVSFNSFIAFGVSILIAGYPVHVSNLFVLKDLTFSNKLNITGVASWTPLLTALAVPSVRPTQTPIVWLGVYPKAKASLYPYDVPVLWAIS